MSKPTGRKANPIWIIGEFATINDLKKGRCFAGGSGGLLCEMLEATGYKTNECYFRYVSTNRPPKGELDGWLCTKAKSAVKGYIPYAGVYLHPDIEFECAELRAAVEEYKPKVVFALGNLALMALARRKGVTNWRGSMIEFNSDTLVIPSFSITQAMSNYDWTFFLKQDLRRGMEYFTDSLPTKPSENFIVRPEFLDVCRTINRLITKAGRMDTPLELGVDIEGRKRITCIGFAWTREDALCIPFCSKTHGEKGSYWTESQELVIINLLRRLFTHENILCHGQNFNYDRQHICKLWGFNPRLGMDTMQAWHTAFPALPKALHTICSFLLPWYLYWKDEGKGHNPDASVESEDSYWIYNCKDCVRTLELVPLLTELLGDMDLTSQYLEQRQLNVVHLRMMLRGVKQDTKLRTSYVKTLMDMLYKYEVYFHEFTECLVGDHVLVKSKTASPWYRSPAQQCKIFYDIFCLPVQKHKKTKRPTCDAAALQTLMQVEPLLKPILTALIEYNSAGVFLATFCLAPLDAGERFHCSYGIGMTETFRDTSSKDAFDYGGNLQNIPKGNELDEE